MKETTKRAYYETDYGIRKLLMSKVQNLVDKKPIHNWNDMEKLIGINLNKFCRTRTGKVVYRIPLKVFNLYDSEVKRVAFNHRNITTEGNTEESPSGIELLEVICNEIGVDSEWLFQNLKGEI